MTAQAALDEFTEYFVRNYPGPDTIIDDPHWHAPKIFSAAIHALREELTWAQPADKFWCETCEGGGTINEQLGGYAFSNPKAECPDCEGKGYWIATTPQPGQPAPVPVSVGEANQQGVYFIKGWDACRIYEGLPCNVDSDDAMRQRMPAPIEQGDAKDAPIKWPKEKRVGRREDMSPDGTLIVGLDSDNDVYVEVSGDRHGQWQSAAVEFCNGGGGGGQSSRTRAALINLMSAIEADNRERPNRAFPPAAILASKPGGTET